MASHCDVVRVENVSTNCWYEVASGGRSIEVTPRRFINIFWACNAGLVALWRDFLASRSLRRMEKGISGGTRALLRGGVETRIEGDGSLHGFRKVSDHLLDRGTNTIKNMKRKRIP